MREVGRHKETIDRGKSPTPGDDGGEVKGKKTFGTVARKHAIPGLKNRKRHSERPEGIVRLTRVNGHEGG